MSNPSLHLTQNLRYVVLNRPYAFVQWIKAQKIPEKYVFMSEPDHVFLRPLPNFMTSDAPGGRARAGWWRLGLLGRSSRGSRGTL